MNYLNILYPIVVGLIAILTLSIDHIWRDKRTNTYKRIRLLLIVAIIVAVVFNVMVSVQSEKNIINLNGTIGGLTKKVATLKNQNSILSILQRMASYISTDYGELSKKYPEGYYLFASNKYTVIPSNNDSENKFTLDWNSCEVKTITDSFLHIVLKSFLYRSRNILIEDLNIVLERKVGSFADGIVMNNIGMFVELIDERKDEIIYVIGFKKVETIPKRGKLDQRVEDFIAGFNGVLIGPTIIDREDVVLFNLTIASGWEVIDN